MALNVAFFSFYYPPLMAPRSIQISRTIKYSRHRISVVCAAAAKASDATLEDRWGGKPARILRVPWAKHGWYLPWNAVWYPPIPDHYRHWAMTAARRSLAAGFYAGHDAFVTFGQPMSDHLVGLAIKDATRLPWVAHFSDPWADSPYRGALPLVSALNRAQERAVITGADRLVFTSDETLDLVMAKYPVRWRDKARVLPHAFDSTLYTDAAPHCERLVIRHLGALRRPRTPDALLAALLQLAQSRPDLLARVRVELIGRVESDLDLDRVRQQLPGSVLQVGHSVDYLTSLRLMREADLLLVLDAPFDHSVFLPSKLVDYVGAGRPILAVSPAGTSTELVQRLGGWTVAPDDPAAIAAKLAEAIEAVGKRDRRETWGTPDIRSSYEPATVVGAFDRLIQELVDGGAASRSTHS